MSTASRHVLVVDDNEDFTDSLVDLLTDEGYSVSKAYTAERAMELCRANAFDAALVDYKLPGTTGTKLVTAMRALQSRIKMVIMTGHPEEELFSDAASIGVSAVLHKPVPLDELLAILDELRS